MLPRTAPVKAYGPSSCRVLAPRKKEKCATHCSTTLGRWEITISYKQRPSRPLNIFAFTGFDDWSENFPRNLRVFDAFSVRVQGANVAAINSFTSLNPAMRAVDYGSARLVTENRCDPGPHLSVVKNVSFRPCVQTFDPTTLLYGPKSVILGLVRDCGKCPIPAIPENRASWDVCRNGPFLAIPELTNPETLPFIHSPAPPLVALPLPRLAPRRSRDTPSTPQTVPPCPWSSEQQTFARTTFPN
jgi:hypothetical protein